MSLITKNKETPPEAAVVAGVAGKSQTLGPVLTAFAMDTVGKVHRALVLRIQDGLVIETKVLEQDDFKRVPQDAVEREAHDCWRRNADPFIKPPAEPPMVIK